MPTTLFSKTLDLLKNRPRSITYEDIEKATGLKPSWLSMFASGQISDPSVNAIQRLYEFLKKQPLQLD